MGCDIHLFVETKDPAGGWVSRDIWLPRDEDGIIDAEDLYEPNRNYDLFAILANVRNRSIDPLTPINGPRGFPDDASPEVREAYEWWDPDGHSHSWFTLRELLDFDWRKTVVNKTMEQTYRELAGDFWTDTIPRLIDLAKQHGVSHDDTRIVFWFDN